MSSVSSSSGEDSVPGTVGPGVRPPEAEGLSPVWSQRYSE